MRFIKQSKLSYCEGSSDKVYEVDLCEAGDGEFVVNARYGRRGSRLRESTKTPYPLELEKAKAIFQRLVAEKIRKGYIDSEGGTKSEQHNDALEDDSEQSIEAFATAAQVSAILDRLKSPHLKRKTIWPLSRVLWRAGVLQIQESLKHFTALIKQLSKLEAYAMAWAIGRIADAEGIGVLEQLKIKFAEELDVLRIIEEAKIDCLSAIEQNEYLAVIHNQFPEEWATRLLSNDDLFEYLMSDDFANSANAANLIDQLYLCARVYGGIREVLQKFAKEHPIKAGTFHLLRRLYKTAEFRRDAEIYGTMVCRFEADKTKSESRWVQSHGRYKLVRSGVFSVSSKKYLRRRAVRHLEQMAEDGDIASYISLATGILLGVDTNVPEHPMQHRRDWQWDPNQRRSITIDVYAPRYGNLYAFTWLTQGESARLRLSDKGARWSFRLGIDPKVTPPVGREEPNGSMWDKAPDALIHLLKCGKVLEVHEFAHKVWNDNSTFAAEATVDDVVEFIRSEFLITQELGMRLAVDRWDPSSPHFELLAALICSGVSEARELGLGWFSEVLDLALKDSEFLATLFVVDDASVHQRLRGILLGQNWDHVSVMNKVVDLLIKTDGINHRNGRLAGETIELLAADSLTNISAVAIEKLLTTDDEGAQWFSAVCFKYSLRNGGSVDATLFLLAIESTYASVREIGIALLLEVSDEVLADNADLVAGCCLSPQDEIRRGVLPVVQRLSKTDAQFTQSLVADLYPHLLRKERFEGLHTDILNLFLGPLIDQLGSLPIDTFRGLLNSSHAAAHVLGHASLLRETKLEDEPLLQVLEWVNHEHAALRADVLAHLRDNEERLLMQLAETRTIVESKWDEVSAYAFEFLRERVPEDRWTVESLVDLCDSNQVQVQDFGREMITRRFRAEDGELYLTKLSQHPTREMQLFATHFLKQHATGQAELILSLEMYFRTVLSAINSGRVAKLRVSEFLLNEGLQLREVGELAMELFIHHSASCAIADRERCISNMLLLQNKWRDLDQQHTAKEVPVWQAS